MPAPSTDGPGPLGSDLLALETEAPAEGELIQVAAIEADTKRSKGKGLGLAAWLAIGWMTFVIAIAVLAPLLPVGDPREDIVLKHPCPTYEVFGQEREQCNIAQRGPFAEDGTARGYLLGGDGIGRSMLARLVYGAQTSLGVSFGAVLFGFIIGGTLGLIAGYFGGRIDTVISSVFNVLLSIPAFILALALVAFLSPTSSQGHSGDIPWYRSAVFILIIAIGIVSVPLLGRITRASALQWSQREFVLAARAQGAKNFRIMWKEVLPNVLPAMLSIALLGIAVAIVAEGALAILGVGVRPPTPSWGNMIAIDREYISTAPHVVFEPAILIFLTVLSLNFLGDVVRSRFDVREAGI